MLKTERIRTIPIVVLVVIFSAFALLPFYMMMIMGTYFSEELYTGLKLLPGDYLRENLHTVLQHDFFRFYGNSLKVSLTSTTLGVFISALTGYAFSKFRFKGRSLLYTFIISTIAVPIQLGLIGFVTEMRLLGWANSLLPLMTINVASPFGVFWMTQYIGSAIPNEILESGRMDGCGEFGIFFRLVLPVIKPAIITIFLILFLWSWNNYLIPLAVINDPKLYTVPLSIALYSSEYRADYAARILSVALSTIPVLIMFSFGSKYLIDGLVAGSVKG